MAQENPEKSKIIIDDDWKAQAQAEKAKLAEEVEGHEGQGAQEGQLPEPTFSTLVSSIVTQILMSLGGYQDPQTKKRYVDLQLAKHYIDTLSMLEEKTKGNLSDAEKKLLDQALYETRMHYVEIGQRMTQMGQ